MPTVCAYAPLEVSDLRERGVLSAGAEQVAQCAAVYAPIATLVKELESFAVICGGLSVVIHCCSCSIARIVAI
jgi:hypothetical protein